MNKIGWGQLGLVLALSRIFSEAANFPSDDINYGMQRFTVLTLSYILLCIILIPAFIWYKNSSGENILRGRRTAAVFVIIYLIMAAVSTITRLQFYASSTVFDAAPPWLIVLFTAIVCLYGLFKGLPAVTRTGVIIAAGFGVLLLTVTIGISADITPDYLYPALVDNPDTLVTDVLSEFSKNAEGVIFAVLCSDVREKAVKSLYLYIPLSFGILIFMTFLYNTVLGEYLNAVNFPFYTLASLSDIAVLQRLDGLDVVIWIMAVIIKLSLLMLSSFSASLSSFRSRRTAYIISVSALAASSGFSFYFSHNTSDFLVFSAIMETAIPFLTAAFIVPLIILITTAVKKRKGGAA